MLTPDQVKPLLLHEDRHVREAAATYFTESWSRDPDAPPMLLEADERFSPASDRVSLYGADQLAVSGRGLVRVLKHLAEFADEDQVEDLNRVLCAAPLDLLIAHEAALREGTNVLPGTLTRFERRRDLDGWSGERLWQELQDLAEQSSDPWTTEDLDLTYAADLVDALARRDVPDVETLCRRLQEVGQGAGWLEIFLVDLAGARGVVEAIPQIVAKLHIDTDYLLEQSTAALVRIGSPEAIRLVREAYPTAVENFRLYSSSLFGRIKCPESEDAILALLDGEDDLTFRTILCLGLCELFSERGVETVLREIAAGYDRTCARLEDELLTVADVLGIELPAGEAWRQEREVEERRLAERIARLEGEWRPVGTDRDRRGARQRFDEAETEPSSWSVTAPIHRAGPKVGRNDPCPCGSGKKFKKCCGRSG